MSEYYKPDLLPVPIGNHHVLDPMHYASNSFLEGTPAQFKEAVGQTSIQVIDAEPGPGTF